MTYSQLTFKERCLIQQCHQNGESQSEIAGKLGRDRSTVCRELARNSDGSDYQAEAAQTRADQRGSQPTGPRKLTDALCKQVKWLLRRYWSPEQIANELAERDGPSLSHEWIYQLIYAEQAAGGELWEYLRHPRKQ